MPKLPRPFVKWAGGKQQLLPKLHSRLPSLKSIGRYHEIFVGGGCLYFSLIYKVEDCEFFISDSNEALIETYLTVRDEVDSLIAHLASYKNTEKEYSEIRAWDRDASFADRSRTERASRLIYLNKTCFNGLYRVNASGQFNVPFGNYKRPNICDEANLRACSAALQATNISVCDYRESICHLGGSRDFFYLDPPYEPVSPTSSFDSYTRIGFDEVDQVRLFKFCQQLARKRARFLLSNSSSLWLRHLYKKDPRFKIGTVKANRAINSNPNRRGPVQEILVRNY